MAKEGVEKIGIEGPGKDSLTPLLEEDAKKYMIGHPAEEPLEESEEEKETKEEKKGEKIEEEQHFEKEKTGEEEKEEEDKELPEGQQYKSLEEATKAISSAKKKMHEATTEAARLREEKEKLQAQINEVLTKAVTSKDGEKPELTKKEEVVLKGRIKPMLQEIEALDAESPDYQDKVDDIYEKHFGATLRERDTRIEKEFETRLSKIKDEIKKEVKEERSVEKTQDELVKEAIDKAKKAGLDMRTGIKANGDDEDEVMDTPDWRLFWDSTTRAPKGSKPDQIVDFAIKDTKRMKNLLLSTKDKAKKRQQENEVLERVTTGKEVREEDLITKPISLTDAIGKTQRRI